MKFRATQYVVPTLTAAYFNRFLVPAQRAPTGLPDEDWAHREQHELLQRSEERLRGLEGKGPGLATVTAIIAAGVIVAVQGGWDYSNWVGRVLLIVAAVYAAFSLITPIYLVGPQMRSQLGIHDLEQAVQKPSPERWLAGRAAEAAASNTDRTIRLANLQTGARNELAIGFIALALWVVLVPATGVLRRQEQSCGSPSGSWAQLTAQSTLGLALVAGQDHLDVAQLVAASAKNQWSSSHAGTSISRSSNIQRRYSKRGSRPRAGRALADRARCRLV